ncbi:MAG: energy transducer TonB [Opitutaceae bacterium]
MIRLFLLSVGLNFVGVAPAAAMEAPVPVRTVAPDFPETMRRNGASGVVIVSCLIDERGNVTDPKVEKSSNVAFEQPALEALQKWKFKPATENGAAVAVRVSIPIKFIFES